MNWEKNDIKDICNIAYACCIQSIHNSSNILYYENMVLTLDSMWSFVLEYQMALKN